MVEEEERRDAGCLMHRSTTPAGFSKKIPDDMTLSSDAAIVQEDCVSNRPESERVATTNSLGALLELPCKGFHCGISPCSDPNILMQECYHKPQGAEPRPSLCHHCPCRNLFRQAQDDFRSDQRRCDCPEKKARVRARQQADAAQLKPEVVGRMRRRTKSNQKGSMM